MRHSRKARKSTRYKRSLSPRRGQISWEVDETVRKRILRLTSKLEIFWLDTKRIHVFRSYGSKSRAIARIWGLPRVWQMALGAESAYIVEVISEKFDKLSTEDQDKVLLHELAHIPRNFSGALVPHTRKKKGSFHDKLEILIGKYHKL